MNSIQPWSFYEAQIQNTKEWLFSQRPGGEHYVQQWLLRYVKGLKQTDRHATLNGLQLNTIRREQEWTAGSFFSQQQEVKGAADWLRFHVKYGHDSDMVLSWLSQNTPYHKWVHKEVLTKLLRGKPQNLGVGMDVLMYTWRHQRELFMSHVVPLLSSWWERYQADTAQWSPLLNIYTYGHEEFMAFLTECDTQHIEPRAFFQSARERFWWMTLQHLAGSGPDIHAQFLPDPGHATDLSQENGPGVLLRYFEKDIALRSIAPGSVEHAWVQKVRTRLFTQFVAENGLSEQGYTDAVALISLWQKHRVALPAKVLSSWRKQIEMYCASYLHQDNSLVSLLVQFHQEYPSVRTKALLTKSEALCMEVLATPRPGYHAFAGKVALFESLYPLLDAHQAAQWLHMYGKLVLHECTDADGLTNAGDAHSVVNFFTWLQKPFLESFVSSCEGQALVGAVVSTWAIQELAHIEFDMVEAIGRPGVLEESYSQVVSLLAHAYPHQDWSAIHLLCLGGSQDKKEAVSQMVSMVCGPQWHSVVATADTLGVERYDSVLLTMRSKLTALPEFASVDLSVHEVAAGSFA